MSSQLYSTKMDLGISSDSDVELAIAEDLLPKPRRARNFLPRCFGDAIDEVTRRQQHRVPEAVVDYLEERLGPILQHRTQRNQPLTPRQQIETFLHFSGTNCFFHLMRDARGPSTHTVHRTVRRVTAAILTLKKEVIRWPNDMTKLRNDFMKIGNFPCVAGALDGCHVIITPPPDDETSYVNRHHSHSINVLAVSGPDLSFYYVNAEHPGSCHDGHVIRYSQLWRKFEDGNLPFPGAVLLGDSAYALRPWLLTPFPGQPEGAKLRYNIAHLRTRNVIERAFGVLKARFSCLKTGIRLRDPAESSKLIVACTIIHNLCLKYGDDELSGGEEDGTNQGDQEEDDGEAEEGGSERENRVRRQNQILATFMR